MPQGQTIWCAATRVDNLMCCNKGRQSDMPQHGQTIWYATTWADNLTTRADHQQCCKMAHCLTATYKGHTIWRHHMKCTQCDDIVRRAHNVMTWRAHNVMTSYEERTMWWYHMKSSQSDGIIWRAHNLMTSYGGIQSDSIILQAHISGSILWRAPNHLTRSVITWILEVRRPADHACPSNSASGLWQTCRSRCHSTCWRRWCRSWGASSEGCSSSRSRQEHRVRRPSPPHA